MSRYPCRTALSHGKSEARVRGEVCTHRLRSIHCHAAGACFVPLQAPLQPANVEPESGIAVKFTTVPLSKFAEQLELQEIPASKLRFPAPLLVTVRVKGPGFAVKFALTDFAASMVTLQAPVPLQAPLQPANVKPESGVAVKLTTVPLAKSAEQLVPQEIPGGELATVPVPVPLFVTVRVKDVVAIP